jgi:hypothetical protein
MSGSSLRTTSHSDVAPGGFVTLLRAGPGFGLLVRHRPSAGRFDRGPRPAGSIVVLGRPVQSRIAVASTSTSTSGSNR